MRWRNGILDCESKGKRLCTLQEYCPDGPNKPPRGGQRVQDAWAPISDANNDWVYIGSNQDQLCKSYSSLNGGENPSWGRLKEDKPFKGDYLCCEMSLVKMDTQSPSWDDAFNFCSKTSGKRLCTRSEYCPQGKGAAPQGGLLSLAAWAAVFDDSNEWVAIGYTFPLRLACNLHSEIAGVKPEWGIRHTTRPQRGVIQCCDDQFDSISGTMSYAEAVNYCAAKSKKLCSQSQYCPSGAGKPPRGGTRPGEAFAPISDSANAWINIGSSSKDNLCQINPNYNPKSNNNNNNNNNGIPPKSYLQCCDAEVVSNPTITNPPLPPSSSSSSPPSSSPAASTTSNSNKDNIDSLALQQAQAQEQLQKAQEQLRKREADEMKRKQQQYLQNSLLDKYNEEAKKKLEKQRNDFANKFEKEYKETMDVSKSVARNALKEAQEIITVAKKTAIRNKQLESKDPSIIMKQFPIQPVMKPHNPYDDCVDCENN